MKIVEFANSVAPDEVAHDEPPHLNLYRSSGGVVDRTLDYQPRDQKIASPVFRMGL